MKVKITNDCYTFLEGIELPLIVEATILDNRLARVKGSEFVKADCNMTAWPDINYLWNFLIPEEAEIISEYNHNEECDEIQSQDPWINKNGKIIIKKLPVFDKIASVIGAVEAERQLFIAISGYKQNDLDLAATEVDMIFTWSSTPQGEDFWGDIYSETI